MRSLTRVMAAVVWLVVLACAPTPTGPTGSPAGFSVLFFNDLHGHLRPFSVGTAQGKSEVGGIARIATLVKRIRQENQQAGRPTFVLVAGDLLQGTPMSTTFKGEPDVACLNRMGVDAATVGNHEFDFGLENFLALQAQAAFPFLSANIVYRESGHRLAESHVRLPITESMDLVVIGVTTRDLTITTNPDNVADLAVLDPIQSAVAALARRSPDGPVILLSHCKHQTDVGSAMAMPRLTAIIGGHDQILLSPHRQVGNVPIFQAFEKGRVLGRLDFDLDSDSGRVRLLNVDYIPVTADILADPGVAEIVDRYAGRMDARFNQVIGHADVLLDGERERIRWQETTLGNFVTDVMRRYTGADIAMINAGSFRASIHRGAITVTDVFTAMPYGNELITIDLNGKEIQAALDHVARRRRSDEYGGFLHVSGISFTINNGKATNIVLQSDRNPMEAHKTYRVAITDFLYAGGDGHTVFKGKPGDRTGLPLRELLVDTIRQQQVVSAHIEGRIRRSEQP